MKVDNLVRSLKIGFVELKVKNGSIPQSSDENCDTVEDTSKDVTEGSVARGEVSWSQHCMSGITLCFKVE